jgi:ribosomal protein S8
MLNNLKNTLRTKKNFFFAKFCRKNNNLLQLLLVNNLIAGFSKISEKTKLVVFVNYSFNFSGSVFAFSNYASKVSKQQAKIVSISFLSCNNIKRLYKTKKRPNFSIKFR